MQQPRSFALLFFILFFFGTLASVLPSTSFADEIDDIQAEINAHSQKIQSLESEIAQYQKTLDTLGTQHQTLQSAIKTIDVSRQQTSTQIQVTQNKISANNLKLRELSGQISAKEYEIELDRQALGNAIRDIDAADDNSLVEQVLASEDFTEAWTAVDSSATVSAAMRTNAQVLSGAKAQLADQQNNVVKTKDQLTSFNSDLSNQKKQLDVAKSEKDKLLTQTKSQESSYQSLIAQKRAEEATFEAALFDLSSRLKSIDDPSAIPSTGKGILRWPLSKITITQYFGKTVDAVRLYASGTHDGIDLAAPIGTPVMAALAGTILATNEGAVQNCQYGKWVLIQHANGLTTLYAHLSQIAVTKGQSVTTGQTVGYSGMTGYATGPHLHFTVYASEGVTLKQYTCKAGPTVTIPIAPPNGYLDPMSYL